jgi:hypothetical protein
MMSHHHEQQAGRKVRFKSYRVVNGRDIAIQPEDSSVIIVNEEFE